MESLESLFCCEGGRLLGLSSQAASLMGLLVILWRSLVVFDGGLRPLGFLFSVCPAVVPRRLGLGVSWSGRCS